MFDSTRDDEKFARRQGDDTVAKLHLHASAPNEKQFISRLVMMPEKLALKLHQLHLLAV